MNQFTDSRIRSASIYLNITLQAEREHHLTPPMFVPPYGYIYWNAENNSLHCVAQIYTYRRTSISVELNTRVQCWDASRNVRHRMRTLRGLDGIQYLVLAIVSGRSRWTDFWRFHFSKVILNCKSTIKSHSWRWPECFWIPFYSPKQSEAKVK